MRASWFHLAKGKYPHQARVDIGETFEEHISRRGFVGAVAMIYHERGPNEYVVAPTDLALPATSVVSLPAPEIEDPAALPFKLYFNQDVALWWSKRDAAHPYALRNLDGDQLFFVHEGTGVLETEFGPLRFGEGDYLFVPKAVTYRFVPEGLVSMLIIESSTPLEPFDIDVIGRHAPYDPSVLEIPDPQAGFSSLTSDEGYEIRFKSEDQLVRALVRHDPFDIVGWKGDLFPFRLNIDDVMPIHSERSHLAPSVGAVFEADGFIVSNLLPQPSIPDLDAEELPDYHRNVDYDEFWFTHVSGPGRSAGELFVTPQGVVHGASEAAREAHQRDRKPTDRRTRMAVGVDTERRLHATAELAEHIAAKRS